MVFKRRVGFIDLSLKFTLAFFLIFLFLSPAAAKDGLDCQKAYKPHDVHQCFFVELAEVEKEMEEDTHTELSRSTSAPAMSPLPRDCKYNLIQSDISLNVQCGFLGRVIPKMQAC